MANLKRKRKNWTEDDEMLLINLWRENIMEFRKCRRNSHIYAKIADDLNKYTPDEVHTKITNFTQRYRQEKKNIGISGGSPSPWKYYKEIEKILGQFKANNLELMKESYLFVEEDSTNSFILSGGSEGPFSPPLPPTPPPATPTPPQATPTPPPTTPTPPSASPTPPPAHRLFTPQTSSPSSVSPEPPTATSSSSSSLPSSSSASRVRPEKKKVNSYAIQKDTLKIAKENQELYRQQVSFSQEMAAEQSKFMRRSVELLEENIKTSKQFASEVLQISRQQLELERDFMQFMKDMFQRSDKNE